MNISREIKPILPEITLLKKLSRFDVKTEMKTKSFCCKSCLHIVMAKQWNMKDDIYNTSEQLCPLISEPMETLALTQEM